MKYINIYDIKGKSAGRFSLDQGLFDGKINKPLLQQAVVMYLANQRRGCASTKTRANVQGGGRKPWRQKGTGRARFGSIRTPIWRGGGIVFGPGNRTYQYKLPQRIKNLALVQSLNDKIKGNALIVLEQISLSQAKTKELINTLQALKVKEKALIIIDRYSREIVRACRNISSATVKEFNNINALDVLRHRKVIFTKQALENLIKLRKTK